ncbi:unnamed protein product [Peronospora belbahrii]|uniref:Transmembrane protein n=1 Tax=Peronospora belbahrii TaxID=622444 RepID=A0AAU9KZN1_9STRA|nr:unnamed protein product [Peronospora belbahrii]CAH0520281.1 unnamed protein product [Peronospora belbahrii]
MQERLPNVVPTLPRITVVPDANPVRREVSSVRTRQRPQNSAWNASFFDCCCSVAPTYCCIITCCPCTTIASVKESLGGCYERTLLYFSGLALGFLLSVGFAAASGSNEPVGHLQSGATPLESNESESIGSMMWKAISAVFLIAFLFGVWGLRTQTRQSLGIRGSPLLDCLSSFFCCFCVVSQLHLELKSDYDDSTGAQSRRGRGDNNLVLTRPVDTLAPYSVM